MTDRQAKQAIVTGAVLVLMGGAYAWAFIVIMLVANKAIGPKFPPIGSDFMVYYAAAKAAIAGSVPVIFNVKRFTALQNALFGDWLPHPLSFRPWLYPLQYLLIVYPLGFLPPVAAFAAFLTGTFAGFAAALRDRGTTAIRVAALLLSPATARTIIAGQNAFLTAGLLIGGFRLLDAYPAVAGVFLGILGFKPQLTLLAPVALIAERRWCTLSVAAATAAFLVAMSTVAFGVEPWRLWLDLAIAPPHGFVETWRKAALLYGASPYAVAAGFGAAEAAGIAIQSAAALIAAGTVYWTFARPVPKDLKLAVLLVASLLADPHLQGYDMTLMAGAVVLVFPRLRRDPLPGEAPVLALAWYAPFLSYGIASKAALLLSCLAVVAFLAYLGMRVAASLPDAGRAPSLPPEA